MPTAVVELCIEIFLDPNQGDGLARKLRSIGLSMPRGGGSIPICPGLGVTSISMIAFPSPAESFGKISGGVSEGLTSAAEGENESSAVEGTVGRQGTTGLVVSSGPEVTLPRLFVRIISTPSFEVRGRF